MKTFIKNFKNITSALVLIIILILIIATLPSLFSLGRPSLIQYYSNTDDPEFMGNKLFKLHFHPDNLWRKPIRYFRQINEGSVFIYKEAKTTRNFLNQAPRYFRVSLTYLAISGLISLISGIIISLRTADKRRNPVFYEFLSFMTIFPDFILILLIQFLFFYINKAAGSMLIRLYTLTASERAILLPLIVMSCYPTLYILRTLGNQLKDIYREPYILFARAKGLSERKIRYLHVGPAAVHLLKGELHKILAILFSNLFITEIMFNNNGLTTFLFNNIHEYNCTVNTIALMIFLYLIIYLLLSLILNTAALLLKRSFL